MNTEEMVKELIRIQADPDHWNLSLDGFRKVCRYFMQKSRSLEETLAGKWQSGKPTGIGVWLVELTTKDIIVAIIEEDIDELGENSYLRSYVDGDSEPLDDTKSQLSLFAKRSYGPIPLG